MVYAAAFVWAWIKESLNTSYQEIDALISEIDAQDCDLKPMAKFSFSHVISTQNSNESFDDEKQLAAFLNAVNIALAIIGELKKDQVLVPEQVISQQPIVKIGQNNVIFLDAFCPSWKRMVYGEGKYGQVTHIALHVPQKKLNLFI